MSKTVRLLVSNFLKLLHHRLLQHSLGEVSLNRVQESSCTKWKDSSPPTYRQWIKDVMYVLQLEKLRCCTKESAELLKKNWQPIISFVKNGNKSSFQWFFLFFKINWSVCLGFLRIDMFCLHIIKISLLVLTTRSNFTAVRPQYV